MAKAKKRAREVVPSHCHTCGQSMDQMACHIDWHAVYVGGRVTEFMIESAAVPRTASWLKSTKRAAKIRATVQQRALHSNFARFTHHKRVKLSRSNRFLSSASLFRLLAEHAALENAKSAADLRGNNTWPYPSVGMCEVNKTIKSES